MEEKKPRVSFIMPAYNAAPYIGAALDSLFAQTFRRFEAIVANDGSPDTPELERVLAPYLPGIVYLKLEKNAGISAARNAAIRVAKGDLLAFLDCDDGIEPIYLEKQVAAFDADPGLDLVWCDSRLNGRPGYDGRPPLQRVDAHQTAGHAGRTAVAAVFARRLLRRGSP